MRGRLRTGAAVALLTLVGLGLANGGYFAPAWGFGAALLAAAAIVAVAHGRTMSPVESVLVAGVAAMLSLTAAALTWTTSVTSTMLEVQRVALYGCCVAALTLLARDAAELVDAGVAAAVILSGWALVDQLVLERDVDAFQGALLVGTIGYANALGALAALAAVAALTRAESVRRAWVWTAAAELLLCTLALTNSRGSALALAVGVVVAAALSRRPLRLLAVSALLSSMAAGIGYVAAELGVTRGPVPSPEVVWESRLVFLLVLAAAGAACLAGRLIPDLSIRVPRTAIAATVVVVLASLGALAVAAEGTGDRAAYWRVAGSAFRDEPLRGFGPGTFERLWAERRPVVREARDAHSLYLETLAEQGVVGFLLLAGVLAVPLVALRRAEHRDVAAAAAGAYAVYLAHAGLDWDWEMPVVTAAGLTMGVAAIKASTDRASLSIGRRGRAGGVVILAVLCAGSLFAFAGNWRVDRARQELDSGRPAEAFRSSTRAIRLQPWSSEPLILNAQSRLALGDPEGARAQLRRALSRDPTVWVGWWLLAAVADDSTEARLASEQAARLNPLNPLDPPGQVP